MAKSIPLPPLEEVNRLLRYEPDTGEFFWRVNRCGVRAGDRAGTVRPDGYVSIQIARRLFRAHRLAWLLIYGETPEVIDHINLDPADNRICNLRIATVAQNTQNSQRRCTNTCGFKGISRNRDRFMARIVHQGKCIHLGTFDTREEAHAAYCVAARKHFGEFARFS